MIFILSYEILQENHKKIMKEYNKTKKRLLYKENKITDLEEEIKLLKQLLNRRNKKIKEKNLIIGWLCDSDKQQEINKLNEQIDTMNKQLKEKDLIIGWLRDKEGKKWIL